MVYILSFSDFNTLEKVKEGKIEFSNSFAKISVPAIDFMKRLLVADKSLRMRSQEAVNHAWLKKKLDFYEVLPGGRLKYFCSRRRWQVCMIAWLLKGTRFVFSNLAARPYDKSMWVY